MSSPRPLPMRSHPPLAGRLLWAAWAMGILAGWCPLSAGAAEPPAGPLAQIIATVQPKVVKVYGVGGLRGMENYQSGFLFSPEGHILTAWSYVLDTEEIDVVLYDGRKFKARLVGADVRLEIAVLKIEAKDLPCFELRKTAVAETGTRVLAVSNLFNVAMGNEASSVQRGTIAVKTRMEARRGVFETPYNGPIYVLDVVTNNPGAAGGALLSRQGELLGMLGKELRNSLNNTWLNYALPVPELIESVEQIRAGKQIVRAPEEPAKKPAKALTLAMLGLVLVPDVFDRTPPYVDEVLRHSPAAKAGIQPDDLIVMVGDRLVPSCRMFLSELQYVDYEDQLKLTVLRGQEMLQFTLQYSGESKHRD